MCNLFLAYQSEICEIEMEIEDQTIHFVCPSLILGATNMLMGGNCIV